MVTNQRHQSIDLPDEAGRTLISLLDGTRDRQALVAAMERVAPGPDGTLESSLQEILRLCLLVG
jgi:hypothetical protein